MSIGGVFMKSFTLEEMELLKQNPNTFRVTPNESFILLYIKHNPFDIFRTVFFNSILLIFSHHDYTISYHKDRTKKTQAEDRLLRLQGS